MFLLSNGIRRICYGSLLTYKTNQSGLSYIIKFGKVDWWVEKRGRKKERSMQPFCAIVGLLTKRKVYRISASMLLSRIVFYKTLAMIVCNMDVRTCMCVHVSRPWRCNRLSVMRKRWITKIISRATTTNKKQQERKTTNNNKNKEKKCYMTFEKVKYLSWGLIHPLNTHYCLLYGNTSTCCTKWKSLQCLWAIFWSGELSEISLKEVHCWSQTKRCVSAFKASSHIAF